MPDQAVMLAARHTRYGSAREVLEVGTAAAPALPAADEILVRVRATSVNPIDCAVRSGYGAAYWESRGMVKRPHIPGRDVAGEVVAVGWGVKAFAVGDAVWAATLSGGSAELVTLPAAWAAPMPDTLSFQEAASLPYVALTTWSALVDRAGLTAETTPGKRVIIPRGAGGVGSFAIQLVKAWGGEVATICSARNVELVRRLGADIVVDYGRQDFAEVLSGYDVAFDTSFDTEERLLAALRTDAPSAYVTVVTPKLTLIDEFGLEDGLVRGNALLDARQAEQAPLNRSYDWSFMEPNGEALRAISALIDRGLIRPVIDRTYPLAQMVEAHEYSESGRAQGKIVIELPNAA